MVIELKEQLFTNHIPEDPFGCIKLRNAISQALSKMRLCLNLNFDGFKRTEGHVGKNFSRCTTKKENRAPVAISQHAGIKALEVLVQTKSATPLSAVTKKLGSPTSPKGRRALFFQQGSIA